MIIGHLILLNDTPREQTGPQAAVSEALPEIIPRGRFLQRGAGAYNFSFVRGNLAEAAKSLKICISFDPVISLPGIYPKDLVTKSMNLASHRLSKMFMRQSRKCEFWQDVW